MASAKQAKPAAAIVSATARTRSVIEDLQARLAADSRSSTDDRTATPPPVQPGDAAGEVSREESIDDLERQLQAYFERAMPRSSLTRILDELRSRVIDRVVDRILEEWATPKSPDSPIAGLRQEVMERLIERVLEEFGKSAESSKPSGAE